MKKLIVANWKMNPSTLEKAKELFNGIEEGVEDKQHEVIICPPFLYLPELSKGSIKLGAQNCFWEESGSFTGEVSPKMIKEFCNYVILGHSERRAIFNESNEMINKKIKKALGFNLKVILCIGENKKEREKGKTKEVLKNQIKKSLKGVAKEEIIVAYEPIWAIGTGNPCSPEEAKKVRLFLEEALKNFKSLILYGGSVNSKNVSSFIKAGYQGVLVGGASLKPKEFVKIVKNA